ncbi:MAG: hypothetical protein ACRD4L_09510 [Pyrinomonadaceae bacterium]
MKFLGARNKFVLFSFVNREKTWILNYFRWPELILLSLSLCCFLSALVTYYFFLVPSQKRFDSIRSERSSLQQQISLEIANKDKNSSEQNYTQTKESLKSFEERYLLSREKGSNLVVADLNKLLAKSGLSLVDKISFTPLNTGNNEANNPARRASQSNKLKDNSEVILAKYFPGIKINFHVAGPYQNIRDFIYALESGSYLITINSMEVERLKKDELRNTGPSPPNNLAAADSLVKLRADIRTFFR